MKLSAVRLAHEPNRVVDVWLQNGKIADISESAQVHSDLVLLPGLVDLHTHLREPGGEDAEDISSGTLAAIAGGFTDVFAMPNTTPAVDTVEQVVHQRHLARNAQARVHPIAAATLGRMGNELVDVAALRDQGVHIFSDDGSCLDDPQLVRQLLTQLAKLGGVFAQHAQSMTLAGNGVANARVASALGVAPWPASAEETVIERDIALAEATGGHLHVCHVSSAGSVEILRRAKQRGAPVTAEVAPHHLMLTDASLRSDTGIFKVNPPLRSKSDVDAVREGLRDGTIDIVATDHAPHPGHRKIGPLADAVFGFTALETALSVVAEVLEDENGEPNWALVAAVLSHRPAAIGGISHHAGRAIRVGEPATCTLVRAGTQYTVSANEHVSRSRNTPFAGMQLRHRVRSVWVEGIQVLSTSF